MNSKIDVDENFKKIIKTHLLKGNYTAIASHDEAMINYTKELVKEHGIASNQFEFQMLFGIREELQRQLVKEGYKSVFMSHMGLIGMVIL
ncbi:proline dehydrogenase 2 [Paenisporosarcina sp. HGH0030]|nr:proline dehydrogenase 2 [Paenisporosarcina sp. HGH0030]